MKNLGNKILALSALSLSALPAQNLRSYQDQNSDTYVEWEALSGYAYTLQSSDDLQFWSNDSTWVGVGQTVSILVHEAPNNGGGGGGGGVIPGPPRYSFAITAYQSGDNLISWTGGDGNPYQLYTTDTFFSVGDDPLFQTDVVDPNGDYTLFLHQIGTPLPPNAASLTLAALPQAEQDQVGFLTAARQQVVNELAANGGANGQNGIIGGNIGDGGYFRLIISRQDSDGDGLYDNLEPGFNMNPYDPDTDQNGVTDPWDVAVQQGTINSVIVSEFMASNSSTIRDGNNPPEFEDYIELFNPTPNAVDLTGHFLTCANGQPQRWQIPAGLILAPGQHALIFASGNNVTDPAGNFHTDFSLRASGGEDVILNDPNGNTLDAHLNWGRQRANASAGWGLDRETGLVSALRYFLDPTPGTLNGYTSCTGFSDPPVFNMTGGIFSNATQSVTLTAVDPAQDIIHYTLDGSNPSEDSPVYSGPITVDATTIIRAATIRPGCIFSPIATRSFIYVEDVIGTAGQGQVATDAQVRPPNYGSLAKQGATTLGALDYEMDPQVIQEHYDTIASDLTEIPTISVSLPKEEIFGASGGFYAQSDNSKNDPADPLGKNWLRLASFEYFEYALSNPNDPNSPRVVANYVQEDGEITISGGSSIRHGVTRKHNMRLRFKSRNSLEGRSAFRFAVAPFNGSPLRDFTQIQLRNTTHDSWSVTWSGQRAQKSTSLREAWARDMHKKMNPLTPNALNPEPTGNLVAHRKWVHVYLNGLYWGIYDLTERVDDSFGKSYGDPVADYDVVSQFGGIVDGDSAAYATLIQACDDAASNLGDNAEWEAVEDILDVDSYIDYMIVNTYMHNTDWPGNNWRAIRRRAVDGKWKFVVWDAEFSFASSGLSGDLLGRSSGAAQCHGILRNHPEYQAAWQARVALHFDDPNGAFGVRPNPVQGQPMIHEASNLFQTAMDDYVQTIFTESARWGDSVNKVNGVPVALTFEDPTSQPGSIDSGDWKRTTEYHRDVFIPQRRANYLQILINRNLATAP